MGDTSWLGMDVTMEKIYAQQFDFIRGLIAKCGSEFVAIHVRRRPPRSLRALSAATALLGTELHFSHARGVLVCRST